MTGAVDSAIARGPLCRWIVGAGLFSIALIGFFLLGMTASSADDDAKPAPETEQQPLESLVTDAQASTPDSGAHSEPGSGGSGDRGDGQSQAEPETSEEPTTKAAPDTSNQTSQDAAPDASTGTSQDAAPDASTGTSQDSTPETSPEPTHEQSAPTGEQPGAPEEAGSATDSEQSQNSPPDASRTESAGEKAPSKKTGSPVAGAVDQTLENVRDLTADKPESLVRAVDETVKGVTTSLSSDEPSDRSLQNLTRKATKPLVTELSRTVDDTLGAVERETQVVKRTVTKVADRVEDRMNQSPRTDQGTSQVHEDEPVDHGKVPARVRAAGGHTATASAPSADTAETTQDTTEPYVPSTLTVSSEKADAPTGVTAERPTASASASERLDLTPPAGVVSSSADTTSGGSGATPAVCGTHSSIVRLSAGWQLVTPPVTMVLPTMSLLPGVAPD